MLIARIVGGGGFHDLGVHVPQIGEFGLVQFLQQAGLDLALKIKAGRHYNVVTGIAGQKFGLDNLVIVVNIVIDPYVKLFLKFRNSLFINIIVPV